MKKGMRLKVFAILFCLTSYFGYLNIMLLSDFIETTDYNCEQIAKADNTTLQQGKYVVLVTIKNINKSVILQGVQGLISPKKPAQVKNSWASV